MNELTAEQRVWRVIEDWIEGYEMRACVTEFMQNQLVKDILTAHTELEDECLCVSEGKHLLIVRDCPIHIMPEDCNTEPEDEGSEHYLDNFMCAFCNWFQIDASDFDMDAFLKDWLQQDGKK